MVDEISPYLLALQMFRFSLVSRGERLTAVPH